MSPDVACFLKVAACMAVTAVCLVELAWIVWDSIADRAPWKAKPLRRKS